MRKNILKLSFVFILLASLHALSLAQENTFEPVAKTDSNPAASNPFTMIVGNGQMIAKPGPVFTEGGDYRDIQLPYLISTPEPIAYPRWAVRQGWQGKFSIALEILTDGKVGRFKVMKSTGHKMLDDAATSAVRQWIFHPATKDGKPVLTCIQIPVVFQLDNE